MKNTKTIISLTQISSKILKVLRTFKIFLEDLLSHNCFCSYQRNFVLKIPAEFSDEISPVSFHSRLFFCHSLFGLKKRKKIDHSLRYAPFGFFSLFQPSLAFMKFVIRHNFATISPPCQNPLLTKPEFCFFPFCGFFNGAGSEFRLPLSPNSFCFAFFALKG